MNQGDYAAVHNMENHLVAVALEEGNLYNIAMYYFLNGSAYACLDQEEMMLSCYQKTIRLLQNTAWKDKTADLYYNIGATCVSLGNYPLALEYLDKAAGLSENADGSAGADKMLILHKKALAMIRSGKKAEAQEILEQLRSVLDQTQDKKRADILRYEEACWESRENFLDEPEYLALLEQPIPVRSVKKE